MSLLGLLFLLSPPTAAPPPAQPAAIEIELKQGSPDEAGTRDQFVRLLGAYDFGRWIFTRKIVVDGSGVIPHSHPVLTLSTRHLKDDDLLVATFIHEQLHWYLEENGERAKPALQELRKLYPDAPAGFPQGAADQDSTYRHLIVCYWEIQAARELLGELPCLSDRAVLVERPLHVDLRQGPGRGIQDRPPDPQARPHTRCAGAGQEGSIGSGASSRRRSRESPDSPRGAAGSASPISPPR